MSQVVAARPRWMISTRRSGEVFAASAESEQSQILLLGIPAGFTGQEVEGWLQDLLGVAFETSRQDQDERSIPVLLHHTLTGLLFSHTELWDRAVGSQPCSAAFVQTPEATGFGWVGDVEPVVRINGQPVTIQWVRVRDHSGREARAFAVDASHDVEVELEWSELPGATGVPAIHLRALWNPRQEVAGQNVALPASDAPSAAEAASPDARASVFSMAGLPAESARREGPDALPIEHGFESEFETSPAVAQEPVAEAPLSFEPVAPVSFEPVAPVSFEPVVEAHDVSAAIPDHDVSQMASEAAAAVEPPASGTAPAWQTVYEVDAPPEVQRDPVKDERRRGFFSWVAGLMKGRGKDDAPPEMESVYDRLRGGRGPAEPAAEPVSDATPDPVAAEAMAVAPEPVQVHPIAAVSEPVVPQEAYESAVPTPLDEPVFGIPGLAPAAPAEPAVPELVPPSPEPAELTARTVDWRAGAPAQAFEVESVAMPPIEAAPVEIPENEMVSPAPGTRRPRAARSWPPADLAQPRRRSPLTNPWLWAGFVAVLFTVGWLVGAMQEDPNASRPNPVARMLRAMGFGGARFDVAITTIPPGAWVAVDGKDIARRTPATIELKPGEHTVSLMLPDLGSAAYTVRGERGDRVTLDAPLSGSLAIRSTDSGLPIAVSVDGRSLGFVPITLDSLTPGPHEIRYSGPGMASWGNTVIVRVGELTETIAHPMTSPATGVIEVRALIAGGGGSQNATNAVVFVDGERRGVAPLTAELSRGPHSVRVEYQGESAPVQVIDLPGGNQRFATFEFGLDVERGQLVALAPPARMTLDRPTVISAALQNVPTSEVREMWLHVRTPVGSWRRYEMNMLKAPGSVVGTAVYPATMVDEAGRARWYVSSLVQTGDEYFTEIMVSETAAPPKPVR